MTLPVKSYYVDEAHKALLSDMNNVKFILRDNKEGVKYLLCRLRVNNKHYPSELYIRNAEIMSIHNNDHASTGCVNQVKIYLSGNNSGGYGQYIKDFQRIRDKKINDLIKNKEIDVMSTVLYNMYKFEYVDKESNEIKYYYDANGCPDFRVPIVLDFDKYPINNPRIPSYLRGKPRTIIKDYRTARLSKDGSRVEYDVATINGEELNANNVYEFINSGSIIVEGYISFISTCCSMYGISTRQVASELVIMPSELKCDRKPNLDLLE